MSWKYFSKKELDCKCGQCTGSMNDDFMQKLIAMREEAGFAFPLSSAYRCPQYNAKVSSTGHYGPHTTGRAVDIKISGRRADRVLELAYKYGMTGRGVNQKGDHSARFIHVDDLHDNETRGPRPWVWSY